MALPALLERAIVGAELQAADELTDDERYYVEQARLPQFPPNFFDMIVVDEGHHAAADSWQKVFRRFPKGQGCQPHRDVVSG